MLPDVIQPETLKIVEAYLINGSDIEATALELGVSPTFVTTHLNKREARAYIDRVFEEAGYRNRNKLFDLLDDIIAAKLEECRETQMYSEGKDLLDILQIMHKMKMEELKLAAKRNEAQPIQNQTNVQINGGDNYNALLDRIINGKK